MNESKRRKNEAQFKNWSETETGGRIYWFEVQGKWGWMAKYVKEVDNEENTLIFLPRDLRRQKRFERNP